MPKGSFVVVAIAAALAIPVLEAQGPAGGANLAIVPLPSSVTMNSGVFTLKKSTAILAEAPLKPLARQLAGWLNPATGFDLDVRSSPPSSPWIQLRLQGSLASTLGAEGYRLTASPKAVIITAATEAGVFYGMQTLRQLLPVAIFRSAATSPPAATGWTIPSVTIEDSPRFSWRGAHLDVSRHFMPKEFVKKYIDLLALHKTEPVPLASDRRPGLASRNQEVPEAHGGRRRGAPRRSSDTKSAIRPKRVFDGQRYGGFYTQDDVREIVAYAAARFITVVPEIEMPGHSQAVVAAYPELGSHERAGAAAHQLGRVAVSSERRRLDDSFMQDVLAEVIDTLSGRRGFTSAATRPSRRSGRATRRFRRASKNSGCTTRTSCRAGSSGRWTRFLTSKGRRLVGWDEILEGGLAQKARRS